MLKSFYIVAYITVVMVLTVSGVRALIAGEAVLPIIALLLTTAPMALFFIRIMVLKDKARTSSTLPLVISLAAAGCALAVYGWTTQNPDMQTPLPVLSASVLLLVYIYWYSHLDRSGSQLEVGEKLPAFTLTSTEGDLIYSKSLVGSPVVLIFYRGNWCPLCMAQVKEMASAYNQLKAEGARVIFVSPQPQGHTKSLAEKFGAEGLEFMTDANNKTANALGIASKYGVPMGMQGLGYSSDTVLPTVIICDKDGTIIWTHETDNYRVRPEPQTYLAVLQNGG
jgi:peroxiredoxin